MIQRETMILYGIKGEPEPYEYEEVKEYSNRIMAKIVQSLTRASAEYEEDVAQSLVRDLDAVLEKLNTTFQEELKQEIEARSLFLD
jgi:phosphopantetheine adenylyltransferase